MKELGSISFHLKGFKHQSTRAELNQAGGDVLLNQLLGQVTIHLV
jgi:hypothetical protein